MTWRRRYETEKNITRTCEIGEALVVELTGAAPVSYTHLMESLGEAKEISDIAQQQLLDWTNEAVT